MKKKIIMHLGMYAYACIVKKCVYYLFIYLLLLKNRNTMVLVYSQALLPSDREIVLNFTNDVHIFVAYLNWGLPQCTWSLTFILSLISLGFSDVSLNCSSVMTGVLVSVITLSHFMKFKRRSVGLLFRLWDFVENM